MRNYFMCWPAGIVEVSFSTTELLAGAEVMLWQVYAASKFLILFVIMRLQVKDKSNVL